MAALGAEPMKILIPKPSQILSVFTKSGAPIFITLDGGATGSFISLECAKKNNFKIWPNNQLAGLPDNKTIVESVGYVEETFYRDKWSVSFQGLVLEDCRAEVYGGTTFMIDNDIIQRPAKNLITVLGKYTVIQTNPTIPATMPTSSALLTLSNLNIQRILLPGQKLELQLPPHLDTAKIAIQPREENKLQTWPPPQIVDNKQGVITIENDTLEPVIVKDDVNLIDAKTCSEISIASIKQISHTKMTPTPTVSPALDELNNSVKIQKDLSNDQKQALFDTHSKYKDVFDNQLTGYNGHFGRHVASLHWADDSRPKSERAYSPKWSSSTDRLLQQKIDQLTDLGVLVDPYLHNVEVKVVHPCFLQKKSRAGSKPLENCSIDEVRFLTAANSVNEKLRQLKTKVPDQNEIFKFVGNNKYLIFADLYESFFQNLLDKKDWGYMAINSPFKGLRVYTRSTQGLLNQDEELSQLLYKVLGDLIMEGIVLKIADDLIVGGNTIDQAIKNWESVLNKLSLANLKLSPSKIRIFPEIATIFGWQVKNGMITPDPHRQLALTKTKYTDIQKIGELRSWMGIFKTFLIAMPGVAELMDPFDKFVAGVKDSKTDIIWTSELIKAFEIATEKSKNNIHYLTMPRRDEQLILMPDATIKDAAIGFTLNVVRENKMLPVTFYSFKLTDCQKDWFPCEREALGVATAVKKCSHFILESSRPTLILTDSKPVVEATKLIRKGKFSASARMSAFLCSINRYKVDIQHVSGKFKNNVAADYLSRNPAQCSHNKCQFCVFIKDISETTISSINTIDNNDIPLGSVNSWKKVQEEDFACQEAYNRLKSGQQPSKKGKNSNDIRRYYGICQAKDMLVVEDKIPNTTQIRNRIVIPKDFVPAVITQLHFKDEKHLSSYQLEKTFNRYFFGIHVKQAINETLDQCLLCKANKQLPQKPSQESISNPQHPGYIFNIDIICRHKQKIMVCTDLFSTFTTANFINNEQAETLLKGIIDLTTPIRSQDSIKIRTDSAPGFKSLVNNPSLQKLNIELETCDPSNKNSIATVDNAIKQLEIEIKKIAPHSTKINETVLALAVKNLNSLIRNRGLSAHEIIFSRSNESNQNLHLSDNKLAQSQQDIKRQSNEKSHVFRDTPQDPYETGDFIAINNENKKHNTRDVYVVTKVFDNKLQVNKMIRFNTPTARLQVKPRMVRSKDVFKIRDGYNIPPQTKYSSTPQQKQHNIQSSWRPFRTYTYEYDDSDDDDCYDTSGPINISETVCEEILNTNENIETMVNEATSNTNENDNVETIVNEATLNTNENENVELTIDHNTPEILQNESLNIEENSDNVQNTLTLFESPDNDNVDHNDFNVPDENISPHHNDNADPYAHLRTQLKEQNSLAKRTLDFEICKPSSSVNLPDLDPEWDHEFDTHSPTYNQDDNASELDVFLDDVLQPRNIFPPLTPMSKVQNVDNLYEAHGLNIDTNRCQNLEHLLNPKANTKKKKVSPPRRLLPLEEERVMTRSMRKQVKLTCSHDNFANDNLAKASHSSYYTEPEEDGEKEDERGTAQ